MLNLLLNLLNLLGLLERPSTAPASSERCQETRRGGFLLYLRAPIDIPCRRSVPGLLWFWFAFLAPSDGGGGDRMESYTLFVKGLSHVRVLAKVH